MPKGVLKKMKTSLGEEVTYTLRLDTEVEISAMLGTAIRLNWTGMIFCQSCGKTTKKSFGEGFCYTCFSIAPEASECIIRPELCRAHLGEGRDHEWEQLHHNAPHVVYLAASDTVKVGVTRIQQVPTRWIDQGAASAIILAETPNRYEAGVLEVALKSFFTDKTNWQRMLKNEIDETIDLMEEKWSLHEHLPSDLQQFFSENDEVTSIIYPVLQFPSKVNSLSLDKSPEISGTLVGIKGQYLLFKGGDVINIRKHTGYEIEFEQMN
jgi:hypothetical protein